MQENYTIQTVAKKIILPVVMLMLLAGCRSHNNKLFTSLSASQTGIEFENILQISDSVNIMNYIYLYNGGGVATGDINNDGLADIYFTSNTGSNKLYLNKGDLKFEDITEKAGVRGKGSWKTGVTMADVNGDGLLDIYICAVEGIAGFKGSNQLFINNGNLTFSEKAEQYQLAEKGFNTQAVFFDYDLDGDLDMYLVKHSVYPTSEYLDTAVRNIPDAESGDKLFRNELNNGKQEFTDITQFAKVLSGKNGYGLNAIINDFNRDGWPDIYVSNDFYEEDYYYINNHDGTFTEKNKSAFGHESRFSMGSDAADINHDGWPDIVTLDMLPADEKILKSSVSDDPLDIYNYKNGIGYHHQLSKNCLQINAACGEGFSETGLYAGIAATDWSWSPLFADFDNDGTTDLFVSNGIYKRPNDLDFIKYYANAPDAYNLKTQRLNVKAYSLMPTGAVANFFFSGNDNLTFTDKSRDAGFEPPGISTGASFADFDNDGDIDIVLNNMNAQAAVYKNNTPRLHHHYLDIELSAPSVNKAGFGATVTVYAGNKQYFQYLTSAKGFQSSSAPRLHFGLGSVEKIDSIEVIWPQAVPNRQMLYAISANQLLLVRQKIQYSAYVSRVSQTFFSAQPPLSLIGFMHSENNFADYNIEQLLPHTVTTQGPKMAVADVNGDLLEDVFICGAKTQPGELWLQMQNGGFVKSVQPILITDKMCEDVNAVFFDADKDGDNDLYVVSGGNELEGDAPELADRLYLNDGKGNLSKSEGLPLLTTNKSVCAPADIDNDGDIDLYVGGRVVSGQYGATPKSYLLINDGKGFFTLQTQARSPLLEKAGMVTDAKWSDINDDGWADLILAGEWMPITLYINKQGKLVDRTFEYGLANTNGLWNCLLVDDLNNDGSPDIVAGNCGTNSKLIASEKYPLRMYRQDIDNSGQHKQIISVYKNGFYYPFLGKEEYEKVMPAAMRKKFLDYKTFAGKTTEELFGNKLSGSSMLKAHTLSTSAWKLESGRYIKIELPVQIQWAPVFSLLSHDFTNDGIKDIVAGGNLYGVLPYEGRYDASYSLLLQGNNKGYMAIDAKRSGLFTKGEVRDIKMVNTTNRRQLLFAVNDKPLAVYNYH